MRLLPNEEIKPIEGYEGLYSITSFGRVWSHEKQKGFIKKQGSFLKLNVDKDGYYYCSISKNNELKSYKIHRLVAQHYILNPLNLPEVNHKDTNKENNHKDNLEWCTQQENSNHASVNRLRTHKIISEYYGVSFRKCIRTLKFWIARVSIKNRVKYIGSFKTELEAAKAYNNFVRKHNLNRPLNNIGEENKNVNLSPLRS